jgi:transcriptional regulator with XRE-family HTH domain
MARKRQFRSGALQALHDRFIGDDPERVASFERAQADAQVAQDIYDLRVEAGLTQRDLAERVGTTASVISRLEDADYEGHSLSMLRRVAAALGRRVEVRFPVATTAPARRRKAEQATEVGEPIGQPAGGPLGGPLGGAVGGPVGGSARSRASSKKRAQASRSKDPVKA